MMLSADSSHFQSETEQYGVILNKDNGGKFREGGDIEMIITLVPKVL